MSHTSESSLIYRPRAFDCRHRSSTYHLKKKRLLSSARGQEGQPRKGGHGSKQRKPRKLKETNPLTSARFVQITTKLTSLTPSNIAAVVAPRVLATYRESMSHSPRVHHVVAELMRSKLPLSLFGVIFSDIIEIFTETYSTKRKYRNTKFLQRLTQEVRLNEFFIQRVRLLASTLEQQEADILGAHIIHRIIEYFYSESEVNTFTDDTPLTSPKPSGECLVGGWALRSSRPFYTAWLDRAAEDKILLLRYAIGIVDALSVPFGDVASRRDVCS